MIRISIVAAAALILASCGSAPEAERSAPQGFADVEQKGATVDNPFATGNAADMTDDMTAVDGAAGAMSDEPRDGAEAPSMTTIPPEIAPAPAADAGRSCSDGKRVCGDMDSCEDAMFHLNQCGMSRLDGDSDGTPCEKICG